MNRQAPPGRTSILSTIVVYRLGPHQFGISFGSVIALKTRSRGASNSRVMTISRSPRLLIVVVELSVVGIGFLLFIAFARSATSSRSLVSPRPFVPPLQLFQVVVEAIETLFPQAAVTLHPIGGLLERARPQLARPPLRFPAALDQTGPLEDL